MCTVGSVSFLVFTVNFIFVAPLSFSQSVQTPSFVTVILQTASNFDHESLLSVV